MKAYKDKGGKFHGPSNVVTATHKRKRKSKKEEEPASEVSSDEDYEDDFD